MQESAKVSISAAGAEIDANKAVVDSMLGIADAAQAPLRSMEEIKAAVAEQQATVASAAKANVDALVIERDANLQLAASYQTIANAAIAGSEQQIAATKLAAEAAIKAGVEVKAAAAEESAAFGGVKSHLLSLGNVLGVTFGAAIGVDLVKKIVGSAAELQKSVEVIQSRFGAASGAVVSFGENAAAKLGISADLADSTSARFGILFSTLGFGQKQAAQMTLGFEKLAGSISAIKGVDPTQVMQSIVLAAAGNTRGLKQLGITIDTTSEKQALFGSKAGLITSALTPAQKTLAIYRIAVRQLGLDQAGVAAHSGDLATKQRKLAAEFANAKDALGKSLLPVFAKYTGELANWLQKMEKSGRLQKDFNSIAKTAKGVIDGVVGAIKAGVSIWSGFSSAVGGSTHAVEILLGVMVASKFAAIGKSVIGLGGAILGIGKSALAAGRTFGVAMGIIDGESVATAAVIDSALIATGIGALVVAIGLAAAFIFTHWDQVKRWTMALGAVMAQIWKGIKEIIIGAAEAIGGGIVAFLIFPMKEFIDVAASAVGWIPYVGDGVNAAKNAVDGLFNSMTNLASNGVKQIAQGGRDIGNVGQAWSDSMAKSASSPASKDKMKKAGGELGKALGDGVAGASGNLTKPLKPVLTALHNAIESARTKIHQTVMDAKNNLVKIGDDLAKTIEQIQAKIGGAAGAIAGSPQGQAFAKLKKLIESGAPSFEIARAQAALSSQLQNVGKTTQPLIKTQLDNLTSALNKGEITYNQFQNRLHKILKEDGISMAQALKAGGPAFANTMKAQVAALGQQAKAITDIPAKFRGIGGAGGAADIKIVRPLQVIQQEQAKIGQAAQRQRDQQIRYARELVKYQAEVLKQQQKQTGIQQQLQSVLPNIHITGHRQQAVKDAGGATARHLGQIHSGIVDETAVASTQRKAHLVELHRISGEVGRLGRQFAAAEEAQVARPLDVLHRDNVRIAATAEQQRDALLKAAQRTNEELRALRRFGRTPGFDKYPHGKGSHDARMGAKAGNRA